MIRFEEINYKEDSYINYYEIEARRMKRLANKKQENLNSNLKTNPKTNSLTFESNDTFIKSQSNR